MQIIRLYKKYCPALMILKVLFYVLSGVATPIGVFGLGRLIHSVQSYLTTHSGVDSILLWAMVTVLPIVLSVVSQYFNSYIDVKIKRKFSVPFLSGILDKLNAVKYEVFEQNEMRDAIARLGKFPDEKVIALFGQGLSIGSAFLSLIGFVFGFIYMAPISGAVAPLVLAVMLYFEYRAASGMNQILNEQSTDERRMQYFGELLFDRNALFELRLYSAVSFILNKWKQTAESVLSERLKITIKSQMFFAISFAFSMVWAVFTILTSYMALTQGVIDVGAFVAFILSIETVIKISTSTGQQITQFMKNSLELKNYSKVMSIEEKNTGSDDRAFDYSAPVLAFKDVSFKYPETTEPAIEHISFRINQGEKLAIVGENGAGKSTLVKLLAGLYRPDEGEIDVFGVPMEDLSAECRAKILAIVFQTPIPYALSLRDNILMGKRTLDDAQLVQLIERFIHDPMLEDPNMPLGKLEDDGVELSGGQWQKIGILRALAQEPKCIVLDEPTAALDAESENRFYEKLLHENEFTQLIITHRLAAAKLVDHVVVIHEGKLIEYGTHASLMSTDTLYRRMYEKQQEWYAKEATEHEN